MKYGAVYTNYPLHLYFTDYVCFLSIYIKYFNLQEEVNGDAVTPVKNVDHFEVKEATTWNTVLPLLTLPTSSDKLRLVLDQAVTSGIIQ